jgi:hypothetical protein
MWDGASASDAAVSANAACFLRPQGAFGVRQLAAAFNKQVKNMDFERFLKRQQAAALRRRRLPNEMRQYACRPQDSLPT